MLNSSVTIYSYNIEPAHFFVIIMFHCKMKRSSSSKPSPLGISHSLKR